MPVNDTDISKEFYDFCANFAEEILKTTNLTDRHREILVDCIDQTRRIASIVDDIVSCAIVNQINSVSKQVRDFMSVFYETVPHYITVKEEYTTSFPLIHKEGDRVRVYENLALRYMDTVNLYTFSHIDFVLSEMRSSVDKELNDSKKCKKWETEDRCKSAAARSHVTTIEKVLQTYFDVRSDNPVDAIRNVGQDIRNAMLPPELIFCKSPEDYWDMYSNGPKSCMQKDYQDEWPFHPTQFYYYMPGVTGVYLKKNDKVLARTITYDKNFTNGDPGYGTVYCVNPSVKKALTDQLEELGYSSLNGCKLDYSGEEFTIKGELWSSTDANSWACPLPYFDNIYSQSLSVGFDTNSKKFHFKRSDVTGAYKKYCPNNETPYILGYDFEITSKKSKDNFCHNCNANITAFVLEGYPNNKFCSARCASVYFDDEIVEVVGEFGYFLSSSLPNRVNTIYIYDEIRTVFRNMGAAMSNGYYPEINEGNLTRFYQEVPTITKKMYLDNTLWYVSRDNVVTDPETGWKFSIRNEIIRDYNIDLPDRIKRMLENGEDTNMSNTVSSNASWIVTV